MPDRLPSLIVLVGFWVPPMLAGWVAAGAQVKKQGVRRSTAVRAGLATFVVAYTAAWFLLNLAAMPPYIPGASMDPTYAPPKAVAGLAVVSLALILPGSALACFLTFRRRLRRLKGHTDSRAASGRRG